MQQNEQGLFLPYQTQEPENPEVPRDQHALAVVNDLLALFPALQAVTELYETVPLDEDDENRLALMFSLFTNNALSMVALLELMQQEVEFIYAFRERDSQSDNSVAENDS